MIPLSQQPNQGRQETMSTSKQSIRLGGRPLVILRALWGLIVLFEVLTLLVNLPAFISVLHTACSDATGVSCNYLQLRSAQLPALAHYGFSLEGYALYALACDLVVTLLFLSVGILIFWRKSGEFMGLFVSLLLLTFGCFGISEVHLIVQLPFLAELILWLLVILQWPALGIFFYTFPDGRFVPRWSWMLTSLFVIQFGFYVLPYPYNIDNWPPLLNMLETFVVYGSAVGTQIYRYRRVASSLQRLQIKWLVFGFVMTLAFFAVWNLLPLIIPSLTRPDSWYQLFGPAVLALSYVPIPLGIGIALLRYRLWDIDILINRTLVYGALTTILILVYVGLIIGLQSLIGVLMTAGAQQPLIIVASTLVIAALFQPLRSRLQGIIDRRFYRSKYDAARTLAAFSATLRNEVDLDQLREELLAVVQETMQPVSLSLWIRRLKQQPSGEGIRGEFLSGGGERPNADLSDTQEPCLFCRSANLRKSQYLSREDCAGSFLRTSMKALQFGSLAP